jgi:hypothetical protein
MSSLKINIPSICIPRVHNNICKSDIITVFNKLDFGKIDRVDIIHKKSPKGQEYKRVFIHFHKWNHHEYAVKAKERLLSGKDIKVVYDFPWFWKISANKWDKET